MRQCNSMWPPTSNIVFGFQKCIWFSLPLTHLRYAPSYQPAEFNNLISYITNSYSQLLALIVT